jgi:hypothetical protein
VGKGGDATAAPGAPRLEPGPEGHARADALSSTRMIETIAV